MKTSEHFDKVGVTGSIVTALVQRELAGSHFFRHGSRISRSLGSHPPQETSSTTSSSTNRPES